MDSQKGGQVSDVVDAAKQKTQDQAGQVAEKGRGMLHSQLDQRSTQAGEQAQSIADTLRQTASQLRQEGDPQKQRLAQGADRGADQLERLGGYLSQADGDELLGRVEDIGRQQPYLIAGAGVLLGIAVGRFLKASSRNRYARSSAPPRIAGPRADTQPLPAMRETAPMAGSRLA